VLEIDPSIDDALQQDVFVSRIGENPSRPASTTSSFFQDVYKFCVRSLEAQIWSGDETIAFVLSEDGIDVDPAFDAHSHVFTHIGRLDQESVTSFTGNVVLATRNLRLAYSTSATTGDALGVSSRLSELGLGSRPTVLFVPGQKLLTEFHEGIEQKPRSKTNTGEIHSFDPKDLDALLNHFHENWTRYPSGYGTCWDNAAHRIVERNAERNIRNSLFVFLEKVVYRSKFVVREYDRSNGRIDIFIFGIAMNEPDNDRVLELKVLRSRSIGWKPEKATRTYSDACNRRYVLRGLNQAKRYIDSTGSKDAFLVCFDARLADVEIPVQTEASALGVSYRRYFMETAADDEKQVA
jgi:hypothetical protein